MLTPRTIFAHFVPEKTKVHIGFQMSRIERAVHRIYPSPPAPPLTISHLGVGESGSMSGGINPLQSEDNSIIRPKFVAVQDVAKPVAQLDAQSISSSLE